LSPKLPVITGKDLVKLVENLGFIHINTVGSHMVFKHPDGRRTTIPIHSGEELGPGLLNKIIKKDLQISRDEFFHLFYER
jgi:predicted RNA binding protein YcfA (HicA-like mRNA interferase family)